MGGEGPTWSMTPVGPVQLRGHHLAPDASSPRRKHRVRPRWGHWLTDNAAQPTPVGSWPSEQSHNYSG